MRIVNRRAAYDYRLLEKFEAGIVLSGPEVKSIKAGHLHLEEAFCQIKNGEVWLFNAHIHPYKFADVQNYDPRRTRKLLLHKKEILKLAQYSSQKGLTIVPISCYTKGNKIKLEIALAKGKKKYEKKTKIKERDLEREQEERLKFGL